MPLYEFRCRSCDDRFEAWLGTADAQTGVACPDGHTDTVRIFSAVAMTGRSGPAGAPMPAAAPAGGCGSACGCHHG